MAARNSRKFEFKLGKTGMVVFILALSLLVFFSFIFGVTVGKHIEVYPEKLAEGIPAMIKERLGLSAVRDETIVHIADKDGKPAAESNDPIDLTFYDTLSGKKGAAGRVAAGELKGGKPPARGVGAQDRADVKKMDPKPVSPVPVEKKGESPLSVSATPTPAADKQVTVPGPGGMPASDGKKEHGKFMIQVVSFQERAKADGVLKQLSTMGYKARVVEVNVPHKGRWFRVIMTGYNNRDDAQQVSDRIAKSVKGVNCVVLSD